MSHTILVTGPDLKAVTHPVQGWTALDCRLRHNEVSAGTITMPASPDVLAAVNTPNNRITVVRNPNTAAGVPGAVVMSGPVEKPGAYRWSLDGDAGPGMITVAFADNLLYLAERVTYPNPAQAANAQTADQYTAAGVNAETLMRTLVDLNAGPGALVARRVPLLALGTVAGVGTNVDVTTRFESLTDVLRYAATTGGGLGFRVRETGGQLLFEVWQPQLRANARFSRARGNLRRLETDPSAPTATVAIVGGTGTGASRLIVERAATTSWRRMEMFVNQSSVSTTGELERYGDEALTEHGEKAGLTAEPIGGPEVLDYLGDLVPVDLAPGVSYVDVVSEVHIQATPRGGVTYTPTVGRSDSTAESALVALVRDMSRRLGRLERE